MEQSTSGGDYSHPAVYFSSPAVLRLDFRETLTHKHIIRRTEGRDSLASSLPFISSSGETTSTVIMNLISLRRRDVSEGVPLFVWGQACRGFWRRPAALSRPMTYVNQTHLTVSNAHILITKKLYEYIHKANKKNRRVRGEHVLSLWRPVHLHWWHAAQGLHCLAGEEWFKPSTGILLRAI